MGFKYQHFKVLKHSEILFKIILIVMLLLIIVVLFRTGHVKFWGYATLLFTFVGRVSSSIMYILLI